MTDQPAHFGAALLARARAALENPADLDNMDLRVLVDDLKSAEVHHVLHGVPWPVDVHVGHIEHRHGNNHYAMLSREALASEIAEYCREWWNEINDPRDPETLPDEGVISDYFENHDREYLSTERISIPNTGEKQQSGLRIRHYLVISNSHIRPATADLLDQWAHLLPEHRPVGVAETGYGWFVLTDPLDESDLEMIPDELAAAISFARGQGCRYLLLDRDGDEIDGLDLFDWP